MSDTRDCQTCGATFISVGAGGLCPACMLRTALAGNVEAEPVPAISGALPRPFGAYILMEEIARGGMGVVYKAHQATLNRKVALKVLLGGAYSSEAHLGRFRAEAESAAGLQHPGIVAIHEYGEIDGNPYYTMEFVEGQDLSGVADGRPLEAKRALRYLREIARAVSFAHERGILHRDLKPSNVLVDRNDRPRVADFGLAKRLDGGSNATRADDVLGSPSYASPEQAAGGQDAVDVRSDVYSLGGLLYYLLTGRAPFLGSTVQETLRLVFEADPIPPRQLVPDVPRDLETICLKCLEKDPARRYATAAALAEDLGRAQRHEPILARPASPAGRAWRLCRRHPAAASLAALVIAMLVATSVIFFLSAWRIERARAGEQLARLTAEDNLYVANLHVLASGFAAAGGPDIRTFREMLDGTRPQPGMRDLRGFEWRHYWLRLRGNAVATLAGHQNVVDSTIYSADGGKLATHSIDGGLKFWDAATHRELASLGGVRDSGGFSADGGRFFLARPDRSIWEYDLATGKLARLRGPTGRLVAVQDDGRSAVVLDADGRPGFRPLDPGAAPEDVADVPIDTCIAQSRDGRRIAVASRLNPGRIFVYDRNTLREFAVIVDPRPVIALALSWDGTALVSAGFDGVLKLWDVEGGRKRTEFKAFLDSVWAVAFSPDGKVLAVGGNNREIRVFDSISGSPRVADVLQGHLSTVHSIAYSPDGRQLASGAEDELAMIWAAHPVQPPDQVRQLLRGPDWADRTPSLEFSPDSRLLAGTAADGTVKVWRMDNMAAVASFPVEARTVAFSPDGKSVLSEAFNGQARTWSLDETAAPPARPPAVPARFADWQTDSLSPRERVSQVAERALEPALCRLCEIPSSRDGINAGAALSTSTVAVSPDGRTTYIGMPDGTVEVWDTLARTRRFVFTANKLSVTALAVSPDGRYLATGSLDNSAKLWDAATGRNLATFLEHNRPVWALAFSPDGLTLAAGSCDKSIMLCSVALGRVVGNLPLYVGLPEGYEQEVRLLRFAPDGNTLAAALGDGSVRFFRAAPFSVTDAK